MSLTAPRQLRSVLQRACAGLSWRGWLLLAAFMLVFAISRQIEDGVTAIPAGRFLPWLWDVADDYVRLLGLSVPMFVCVGVAQGLAPASGPRRALVVAVVLAFATLLGIALRRLMGVLLEPGTTMWGGADEWFIRVWLEYLILGAAITVVAEFIRRKRASVAAMHSAEIDRLALERERDAARIQVLQAQIEPHFLFNTLANVRRLYQLDPAAGKLMLGNLMQYLAVALPRMRADEMDLARETDLCAAYLQIQRIRMGTRLAFTVDIPPALKAFQVPSMMLLTLVENAIKHGVGPLPEGGAIHIRAHLASGKLVLAVADTGRGIQPGAAGGTGLTNIRERLAVEFGSGAGLKLEANVPRGVVATLTLPSPARQAAA